MFEHLSRHVPKSNSRPKRDTTKTAATRYTEPESEVESEVDLTGQVEETREPKSKSKSRPKRGTTKTAAARYTEPESEVESEVDLTGEVEETKEVEEEAVEVEVEEEARPKIKPIKRKLAFRKNELKLQIAQAQLLKVGAEQKEQAAELRALKDELRRLTRDNQARREAPQAPVFVPLSPSPEVRRSRRQPSWSPSPLVRRSSRSDAPRPRSSRPSRVTTPSPLSSPDTRRRPTARQSVPASPEVRGSSSSRRNSGLVSPNTVNVLLREQKRKIKDKARKAFQAHQMMSVFNYSD